REDSSSPSRASCGGWYWRHRRGYRGRPDRCGRTVGGATTAGSDPATGQHHPGRAGCADVRGAARGERPGADAAHDPGLRGQAQLMASFTVASTAAVFGAAIRGSRQEIGDLQRLTLTVTLWDSDEWMTLQTLVTSKYHVHAPLGGDVRLDIV